MASFVKIAFCVLSCWFNFFIVEKHSKIIANANFDVDNIDFLNFLRECGSFFQFKRIRNKMVKLEEKK